MTTHFVYVIFLLLGLLVVANAHPIMMDGAFLGTIDQTPFVNVLLDQLKQSVSIPDALLQTSQLDVLNIASSLTATVLGGGIAMYLT
ncbi:hypothetical protein Clacol_002138 [Clathrus columnatus]|uniref:Uncharacterized protein n=1 Tax=Clathrus columnatus TaxID=1419009 RepID=A0AAV5A4H2_9AGAM|nr:hypothetical protein Clacol_002138 [Clathrus columnatus]